MTDKKWAVIIPTIRPTSFTTFLEAWTPLFEKHNVTLFVMEDTAKKTIKIPKTKFPVRHYDWRDVTKELGTNDDHIIPIRTGSCRSFGFLKAYQEKFTYYLTLDDDVLPRTDDDIFTQYENGFTSTWDISGYFDVGHMFGLGEYMRGFPFKYRKEYPVGVQYGGWDNVPDFDAITQSQAEKQDGYKFNDDVYAVPVHMGFTGCIMNTAFTHETLPLGYQLIMGMDSHGLDRWDDMWSGLFIKRILDHMKAAVLINGVASVVHTRASNTQTNLLKESAGYGVNEELWDKILTIPLTGKTYLECYEQLAYGLKPEWFHNASYGQGLKVAMLKWLKVVRAAQ